MGERARRVAALAALLALVLAVVVTVVVRAGDRARLSVVSVPDDLTLTLDGTVIDPNAETTIRTGQHVLAASRRGFESRFETFTVEDDQRVRFAFYLVASGPEGRAWYRAHPGQALEAEGAGSRQFDEDGRRMVDENPLISRLPLIGPGFRIDQGLSRKYPGDPTKVGIYIREFGPGGRVEALRWMRENGFDPAAYEIVHVHQARR